MTDDKVSVPTKDLKNIIDRIDNVLDKQVREYSGRKRINITNTDGLVKDDAVVVMKKSDYDDLMTELYRLQELEKDMNNQKVTAGAIGDKFIKPLQDSYDDIISGLNDKIDAKDKEINRLKAICSQYSIDMNGLSKWDMLIHNKHKKVTDDFHSKIWITRPDTMVTDAEVMKLDGDTSGTDQDSNGGADNE